MMSTRSKLTALRNVMRKHALTAYLVPTTDDHLNEYVPPCWKRREWLSGFTGSAGDLLVMQKRAILWTDGRYFLQAEQQLEGSGIELFRKEEPDVPKLEDFLRTALKKGSKVGVDPRVLSMEDATLYRKNLTEGGSTLKLIDRNLVDRIWMDRPPMPNGHVEVVPAQRAGESVREKLTRIRDSMKKERADALVITTLDAVAWTFNVRGNDVAYCPVVIAYGLVTMSDAWLFVDPRKVDRDIERSLGKDVKVVGYDSVRGELRALARQKARQNARQKAKQKARVWVDEATTNQWVAKTLGGCSLITRDSPIPEKRAKKNPVEIDGTRRAHIRDGVAMVRFLRWLSEDAPNGTVTELSAEAHHEELRAQGESYRGPSFRTISAFGPHGAIVHYSATESSNARLENGILLFDTGGQYLDGTTDITRTIAIGSEPNSEQRRKFTLVLKGHIAVAQTRFPEGVRGMRLDTIARTHLWNEGLDYNHGTGHGVGAFLSVHEGPQAISPIRCKGAFVDEGNILSNEPGCYTKGEFGVRIENLMLVVKDEEHTTPEKKWLQFETLTLCPIDRSLVDETLLTSNERAWLDDYHQRVERTLAPLLTDPRDREWLAEACKPIP